MHAAARSYRTFALIAVNTVVLLVLVNVLCWIVLEARTAIRGSRHRNELVDTFLETHKGVDFGKVYPGVGKEALTQLLYETWSRPYVFEPFTQFKERPFAGTYVNVHEAGFRYSENQATWPPDKSHFNVFVFGGSSTFGYGVADHQTVPSQLQKILRDKFGTNICLYNFGRGYYYSVQERVLFENLALSGFDIDLAVFIDGLNDFFHDDNIPANSALLEAFIRRTNEGPESSTSLGKELLRRLPAHQLGTLLLARPETQPPPEEDFVFDNEDEKRAERAVARYLDNKRMTEHVASGRNVKVLFVWQPVPTFRYDLRHHLFRTGAFGRHALSRLGYQKMQAALSDTSGQKELQGLVWLADMQEDLRMPLYVDSAHYSAFMSQLIAQKLADEVVRRKMVGE